MAAALLPKVRSILVMPARAAAVFADIVMVDEFGYQNTRVDAAQQVRFQRHARTIRISISIIYLL